MDIKNRELLLLSEVLDDLQRKQESPRFIIASVSPFLYVVSKLSRFRIAQEKRKRFLYMDANNDVFYSIGGCFLVYNV